MAEATATTSSPEPERKERLKNGTSHDRKKSATEAVYPPEQVDFQGQALQLEEEILESRTHYNSIHTLLGLMHRTDGVESERMIAAVTLCRVFCKLMAQGRLNKLLEISSTEATISRWLRERLQDYEQGLLLLLRNTGVTTQTAALTVIVRLAKEKASHLNLTEDAIWQKGSLGRLIQTLSEEEVAQEVRVEFVENYVERYDDVRYYTFACLGGLATKSCSDALMQNMLGVLAAIKTTPLQQKLVEKFYLGPPQKANHDLFSLVAHKKQAQRAWMALLRRNLSKNQRKMVLGLMTHRIAPWFVKVEFLMDFLTDSFNFGGSTSLLSLSGLFYLIQHRNLDYPQFYLKLYSLLDSNILYSKHRSRFFRLLDVFLASTHLPAALIASFVKRLARLSLFAPPSGIVVVIPWIYNLLKSHPSCTLMIHRIDKVGQDEGAWGDPFRQDEPDPMETDALESSLWEVQMLQSHHHPNVATIAKIISEQFTKQAYNLEDFLDHSYGTILDAELSKTIKKIPEIEYRIPKKIFMKHDVDSVKDGLSVKLWRFT